MSNSDTTIVNTIYSVGNFSNQAKTGAHSAASNADSDEYLNMSNTEIHVPNAANPSQTLIASIIPNAVATPLPPLKRKNIGNK